MEKNIQNIKKIVHIGTEKVKREERENFNTMEPKVEDTAVTAKVEFKRKNKKGAED